MGKRRLRVSPLQRSKGRANPGSGGIEAGERTDETQVQPARSHTTRPTALFGVATVSRTGALGHAVGVDVRNATCETVGHG